MNKAKELQLIEVLLNWEGGVNSASLQRYFNISRTTAQRHIDFYKKHYAENISGYDATEKLHITSRCFTPKLTLGELSEYLAFFDGGEASVINNLAGKSLHIEVLKTPTRNIEPTLIRHVIKACKLGLRLDIGYYSVSSGINESRIISPHTLIFDGIRWHTRAWCERSLNFKDFVLSRFHDEPVIEDARATKRQIDDKDWSTIVELVIEPDPRLSEFQRKAIELDYMMSNGQLIMPCRGALIKYLIQKLRLDSYDPNPKGQQIIINSDCWLAIEPYRMK